MLDWVSGLDETGSASKQEEGGHWCGNGRSRRWEIGVGSIFTIELGQ